MLKKIVVSFFLIILYQSVNCQSKIDSLESLFNEYTNNEKKDGETISLIKLLYENYKISQPDIAIEYATIALEISVEIHDTLQTALLNRMIGDIYFNQKIYYLAMKSYYETLKIFDKLHNQNEYAYSLVDIANTHYMEEISYEFSINYYLEAINIFNKIDNQKGLAETYNLIALVYSQQENYKEATEYLFKSLKICEAQNCYELEAQAFIDLSEISKNQKKYKFALQYLDSAYTIYDNYKISKAIINSAKANIYFLNENYAKAIEFYNKSLLEYKQLNDNINVAEIYNSLSNIYLQQQDYNLAIENAQTALKIADINYYLPAKQNSYFILSKIYTETEDLDLAFRSFNLYTEIKDSLFAMKNADRYTDLTVSIKTLSYENEKKILQSETQIQELKNKRQLYIIYFAVLAAISFLIISIVVYSRFSFKKKSEKRLIDLANASVEGIAIHDKGILVEVNNKFSELTGFKRDELIGKKISEFVANNDKSKFYETISQVENSFHEIIFLRKDQSNFLAEISSRSFIFKKINMKVVSVRDITEQKLAQKLIKETELKFKTLVETSPDGVVITDKLGNIEFASNTFLNLFEINKLDSILNKNITTLFAQTYAAKIKVDIENIIKGIYYGVSEYKAFKKSDLEFFVECNGEVLKDSENNINGVFLIIRDVTERKLMDNALINSEARFRSLFDNAKDGILIHTLDYQIIDTNPYAQKILEFEYNELININFKTLFTDQENNFIDIQKINKTSEIFEIEIFTKKKRKIFIQISLSKLTFVDNDFYMSIIRDITYKKIAEENLKNYANNLKQSNSTKDKMFSIIAHDLRGPIGNLKAMMELLLDNPQAFEQKEITEILTSLKDSSASTFELLENLLNWAKSQQGLVEFQADIYNFTDIVNSSINSLKANIINKNIKITNNLTDYILVTCDINMIKTVLRNLISNAIKFTKNNGEVIINYKLSEKNINIEIKDNGIGIKPENVTKLFNKTEYFSTYGTNNEKGSGLGLNLCKEFIEKNSGTIWVESIINEGTSFWFTLPLAQI